MDSAIPADWRNLNATQRDILVLLAAHSPRTGAELNDALGVDNRQSPVAYNNLSDLRARNLVETNQGEENVRVRQNELTASGRELAREAVIKMNEHIQLGVESVGDA